MRDRGVARVAACDTVLQVLSEGEFVLVGATEPVRVRFALVSASLRDIQELVREGRFREDLYYRLSGATLLPPALRDRADRDELVEQAFVRAAALLGTSRATLHRKLNQFNLTRPGSDQAPSGGKRHALTRTPTR